MDTNTTHPPQHEAPPTEPDTLVEEISIDGMCGVY